MPSTHILEVWKAIDDCFKRSIQIQNTLKHLNQSTHTTHTFTKKTAIKARCTGNNAFWLPSRLHTWKLRFPKSHHNPKPHNIQSGAKIWYCITGSKNTMRTRKRQNGCPMPLGLFNTADATHRTSCSTTSHDQRNFLQKWKPSVSRHPSDCG